MVVVLAVYAWRDWFKSLCGLIVMMAFFEHPDMPRSVAGIPGLNLWNVLTAVIVLAWVVGRDREGLRWDMRGKHAWFFALFILMMFIGFVRMMLDRDHLAQPASGLVIEYGLNMFKWLIPAVLLFDGCRTRKRIQWAVASLLLLYGLLAVQAIRYAPLMAAFDRGALEASRRVIYKNTGYNTCDLGPVLAGASWAFFASTRLFARRWFRLGCFGCGLAASYGMVVCGARAGMLAWVAVGLVFGLLRWRKLTLVVAPVVAVLMVTVFVGFTDRMLEGFGATNVMGQEYFDTAAASSGRMAVWPIMLEGVQRAPIFGYGRLGYITSGVAAEVAAIDSTFPHPHNMFIQLWLDNGLVGAIPAYLLFGVAVITGAKLLRSRRDPLAAAAGGWILGLTLAVLVAGIGSMTFYPRESLVGMWCAILLCLRVRQLQYAARPNAAALARPSGPALRTGPAWGAA